MSDDLPPLDPELASLFAEERARSEPLADAAQERALARIEASIAPVAPVAPALAAKLGPLLVALAAGGAVGAGVTSKLQEPKIVYVERPLAESPPARPSSPESAAPVEVHAEPPPESPKSAAHAESARARPPRPSTSSSVAPEPSPSNASPIDTLARERALLDTARASLAKGDAAAALAATERHAREFPRGQMAEEREVLAIQSLAKLGRASEAETRAADFKSRYPRSVLSAVVDSVTDVAGVAK